MKTRREGLSEAGWRLLRLAAAGEPLDTGLSGRGEYGGMSSTLMALRRRGFLDEADGITAAGRAALDQQGGRNCSRQSARVLRVRSAGDGHQVLTVAGGGGRYRRKPCSDCPWRIDATGVFPAEAFVHSAATAYDMATHTFACHQSGSQKPATCAGFLLRGADHNLSVRLGRMRGKYGDVTDGGHALHTTYRTMAIANGVDPDEPVLLPCREPCAEAGA